MSDSETAESHEQRGNSQENTSTGPGKCIPIKPSDIAQINRNIKMLAEAIKAVKDDVSDLKRKPQSAPDNTGPSKEKQRKLDESKSTPGSAPPAPQSPGPSINEDASDYESEGEEIDSFMSPSLEEEAPLENEATLDDLESFFDGQDETGPDVSERMAKIANKALRGKWVKKTTEDKESQKETDDDKFSKLKKKHRRPANVENLQVPKTDQSLWRQLKRETRTMDFLQHQAMANYNLFMTPLVKALDLFRTNQKQDATVAIEYVIDAFKILGMITKQTVMARRERIKKELLPHMRTIAEEDATATHLFGDNLPETIKKLQGTKSSITTTHQQSSSFLSKRGGHRNNKPFNKHQRGGSHAQQNQRNRSNFQHGQYNKKKPQQNPTRK